MFEFQYYFFENKKKPMLKFKIVYQVDLQTVISHLMSGFNFVLISNKNLKWFYCKLL